MGKVAAHSRVASHPHLTLQRPLPTRNTRRCQAMNILSLEETGMGRTGRSSDVCQRSQPQPEDGEHLWSDHRAVAQ